jgi:predicted permease
VRETADVIRRAARRLIAAPAFTIPVVLTLAIGIGAAAAVSTLVDGVLLRPLPYPDAERLVTLRHSAPGLDIAETGQSVGTYVHYRAQNRVFADVGAYWDREQTITDGNQPERIRIAIVTPSLFSVLKVPPIVGQWLAPTDAPRTVMISHGLWMRRYGGDSSIVGRTIEINRAPSRVAGVMPPGFGFPTPETQLWLGTSLAKSQRAGIGVHDMYVTTIARLRPGVSPDSARRDIDRMIPGLAEAYSDAPAGLLRRSQLRGIVIPLQAAVVRDVRPVLLIVGAAAAVVLLIVWANATTLVLLRAERQQPDVAVELALGATIGDLLRRFLSEATLLVLAGGIGGFVLASIAVAARFGVGTEYVPRLDDVRGGGTVVAVVVALSAVSLLLLATVALARALRLRGSGSPFRAATRLTASRERLHAQRSLVAVQLALALVLLTASAILARSFQRLTRVDVGFDPAGVVTLEAALPVGTYTTYHSEASFYARLLEQLRAVPRVTAVEAVQSGIPLTPIAEVTRDAVAALPLGSAVAASVDTTAAASAVASPGYFRAMRIPLLQGRTFTAGDLLGEQHPVVISASLARALFSGGPALNRQLRLTNTNRSEYPPYTVVGVVGDVPGETIAQGPAARLYFPMLDDLHATPEAEPRIPYYPFEMTLVVRTGLPPATVAATVRRIVSSIDPKVPVWGERSLESVVTASMARVRLATLLFLVATTAALTLGIIGIYGVMSYAVSQRTYELGVRLALGASPQAITQMVVRDGARIAIAGIVFGLLAAWLLTRLLRAVLFQVSPSDPIAFVSTPTLLLGLSLLAAYLPARRAGRTDPVTALKSP